MKKIGQVKINVFFFSILALGLALRLYNLAGKPIWYDEADSIANASKPLQYFFGMPELFRYKITYFLLLKGWMNIFGYQAYTVRLLSVIFAVLSLYAIYKLALILYDSQRIALWSTLLLSVSPFHICHSQQVRHHALMLLLVIISYYFFVKLFLSQKSIHVIFSCIINFLLLNMHPYGILIVIAQYVILVCFNKNICRNIFFKWFILQGITFSLYLFLFLIPSSHYVSENTWWISRPRLSGLGETFLTFMFGRPTYGLDDYERLSRHPYFCINLITIAAFCYLFLYGIGTSSFKRECKSCPSKFNDVTILSWLLMPLIISYIISYFKPVFLIKHLIYILPPFLIFTAKGISLVRNIFLKISLVIWIILPSIPALYILYNYNGNINWRQPAEYIYKNLNSGDSIMIYTSEEIVPFMYYFGPQNKDKFKTISIYGYWTGKEWENVFKYGNITLVGIRHAIPNKPAISFEDFLNKYADNKYYWHNDNIWIAVRNRDLPYNFFEFENKLKLTHSRVFVKAFNSVIVYYWKKL